MAGWQTGKSDPELGCPARAATLAEAYGKLSTEWSASPDGAKHSVWPAPSGIWLDENGRPAGRSMERPARESLPFHPETPVQSMRRVCSALHAAGRADLLQLRLGAFLPEDRRRPVCHTVCRWHPAVARRVGTLLSQCCAAAAPVIPVLVELYWGFEWGFSGRSDSQRPFADLQQPAAASVLAAAVVALRALGGPQRCGVYDRESGPASDPAEFAYQALVLGGGAPVTPSFAATLLAAPPQYLRKNYYCIWPLELSRASGAPLRRRIAAIWPDPVDAWREARICAELGVFIEEEW